MSLRVSRSLVRHCLLAALLSHGLAVQAQEPAVPRVRPSETPPKKLAAASFLGRDGVFYANPADARTVEVLQRPISLDLQAAPLVETLEQLGRRVGLNIVIDRDGLDEAHIPIDLPLTGKFDNLPLHDVLHRLLTRHELCHCVEGDTLRILYDSAPGAAASTRFVDISDLPIDREDPYDAFGRILRSAESYASYPYAPRSIVTSEVIDQLLTVSSPSEAHIQNVLTMVRGLRTAVARQRLTGPQRYAPIHIGDLDDAARQRVAEALRQRLDVNFEDTPLREALAELSQVLNIPIRLDEPTLEKIGYDPDFPAPVRLRSSAAPARQAIRDILSQHRITYRTLDDGLIVGPRHSNHDWRIVIYPVGDLLVDDDEPGDEPDSSYLQILGAMLQSCGTFRWQCEYGTWYQVYRPAQCLVVLHPEHDHAVMETTLTALRQMRAARTQAPPGQRHRPELKADAPAPPPADGGVFAGSRADMQARQRILAILQRPARMPAEPTPLDEVLEQLAEQFELNIVLDRESLEGVGIEPDLEIQGDPREEPLGRALQRLLAPIGLHYQISGGVLRVVAPENLRGAFITRIYDVRDLADDDPSRRQLIDLIQLSGAPQEAFHDEPVLAIDGLLSVTTSQEQDHEEVEALLGALRHAVAQQRLDGPARYLPTQVGLSADGRAAQQRIRQALERPISIELLDVPLREAVGHFAQAAGLPLALDDEALEWAEITGDEPVRLRLRETPVRQALREILRPLGLDCYFDGTRLLVRPDDFGDDVRVIYPVADLVLRTDPDTGLPAADYRPLFNILVRATSGRALPGCFPYLQKFERAHCLVIDQTPAAHDEIEGVLASLRAALTAREAEGRARPEAPAAAALKLHRRIYRIPRQPAVAASPAGSSAESKDEPAKATRAAQAPGEQRREPIASPAELVQLIQEEVLPASWQAHGGQARIRAAGELLIVWQTPGGHRRIQELMDELELAADATAPTASATAEPDEAEPLGAGGGFF